MFHELLEGYQPGNIQLPQIRLVDDVEWQQLTAGYAGSPPGYETHRYLEANFLCAFAEARHVEFVDLHTGKLCLPPERFLIPVFQKMARSKGPFVVAMQYGFRDPMANGHEQVSSGRDDKNISRVIDPLHIITSGFADLFDWKRGYSRFTSKYLDIPRWDADLGTTSTKTSVYALSRYPQLSGLLVGETEYLIHLGERNAKDE
jgi:hypothetical protein